MYCSSFLLDHRALALRWTKTTDGLSEIITTHGTYLSDLSPMEHLDNLSGTGLVVLQTAPSDHIDCVWILNDSFQTVEVGDNLTNIVFDDGTSLPIPESKSFIVQKCKRLHTFVHYKGRLNYIFPCIKEFNQHYYSSKSHN